MFSVTTKRRSATIIVRPEFDQMKVSEAVRSDCSNRITSFMEQVNKEAKGGRKKSPGFQLHFTPQEIADISSIALRAPVNSVLAGVEYFYNVYIKQSRPYENAGALIRAFATDHMQYGFISG